MKQFFLISGLAVLALASCTKEYTCSCASTTVNFNYPTETFKDSKDNAKALCDARTVSLNSSANTNSIKCELK